MNHKPSASIFQLAVIVSALGFFVDVYDLLLFAIIRKPSLAAIGLRESQVLTDGEFLLSLQMVGMLIGGILFGILGDKLGRLRVLFGSILLYSLANIGNGLVTDLYQYSVLRFLAGVGLAGELGAGVTLVSEQLPKEKRSLAAGFIAGFGVLGAVAAFGVSKLFDWRICYFIGGGMGIILLLLRLRISESTVYLQVKNTTVPRGNFLMFFNNRRRFIRYLRCILIGIPVWYIIGILITFSDQFGSAFGVEGIEPGQAIMYFYLAVAAGDYVVGWMSERIKSRKRTLYIFYLICLFFLVLFFAQHHNSAAWFYTLIAGLGFGAGLNVIYLTMGVEQFGTNLRASAAISISNMVRGSTPLLILLFKFFRTTTGDYVQGAILTGVLVMGIAIWASYGIEETYGRELDFVEK